MLTGLLLGVILVMRLFPETPLARGLHRHLVEGPVRWGAKLGRRHLLFMLLAALVLLVGAQTAGMFGSADVVLAYAWDLSIYLDALAVSAALAAAAQLKAVYRPVKAWLSSRLDRCRPLKMASRNRSVRVKPERNLSANDDEAEPAAVAA